MCSFMAASKSAFQSTLSMRRANGTRFEPFDLVAFQSTLSMRRANALSTQLAQCCCEFQSTLSMRRAIKRAVSSDVFSYFNPRSP